MCSKKTNSAEVGTQTVIRVFPHILDQHTITAQVRSDKKLQSQLSIRPDQENEKFYSMLRYTPYRDICENSVRVIDLPRKVRLTFTPTVLFNKVADSARMFSLADDDGVGYICSEIIHRLKNKHRHLFVDADTQTDLKVRPHLLEEESVAEVLTDNCTQTTPPASLR